jgi:hypothetical protein
MIKAGEEVAEICVEHPVHLLPFDSDTERIQRMMRVAPGPEPIGEAEEVLLVDGVEHLDDCPLKDLVLDRGDAERPLPPVSLRDVHPPRWTRPIGTAVDSCEQAPEIVLQVLPVVLPRHPVHSRCSLGADRPVGRPEAVEVDMVQQRGEPCILVLPCYFTHTIQPV